MKRTRTFWQELARQCDLCKWDYDRICFCFFCNELDEDGFVEAVMFRHRNYNEEWLRDAHQKLTQAYLEHGYGNNVG